jgi:hypothetical protein
MDEIELPLALRLQLIGVSIWMIDVRKKSLSEVRPLLIGLRLSSSWSLTPTIH